MRGPTPAAAAVPAPLAASASAPAPVAEPGPLAEPSPPAAPAPPAASHRRLVVLYDRDCGLCTATAKRLRRWDRAGRLVLLALQEAPRSARPGLAAAARDLPLAAALHVVDETSGEIHAGGDAAIAIAKALPGIGGLARVAGSMAPIRWGIGRAYDLVARNRHRIGRWLRLEGPACDVTR